MNVRSLLSVAAIISTLAVPGMALGQEEHMISGKAVPADQVTEVQTKCDELRKAAPAADAAATPAPADSTAAASTTAGWLDDGSKIDVTKLTVALCDEGKFAAAM
ncbi:MAG: hypothetical protein EOP19_20420 [Hyphomicrobiales bacterium]|nr:MAG: hypothetical protein EOP19_20420 [Hyphomicrobiales bacterium]